MSVIIFPPAMFKTVDGSDPLPFFDLSLPGETSWLESGKFLLIIVFLVTVIVSSILLGNMP